MRIFLMVFFLCASTVSIAQDVFQETQIYTDTLGMDLFVPRKSNGNRPVLIYVHGGGFAAGKRDAPDHLAFCRRFAEAGWVTATISYHLTMKGKSFSCDQPVENKLQTILEAAQNINQAVSFLLERSEDYRIDREKIVIAGSSAGAEAVLHAAYWDEARLDILPVDFQYAALISMAGALLDKNWITKESAVPMALFHGTCDNLVPYGTAPHHYCDKGEPGYMMLDGSNVLAARLGELDRSFYLITDCKGGHEWAGKPIQPDYVEIVEDFLNVVVLRSEEMQTHTVLHEGSRQCENLWDFCE